MNIPKIQWFDFKTDSIEDMDNSGLHRFNVRNVTSISECHLNNYYAFKIEDRNEESKTGYYLMCISKEWYETLTNKKTY